jgi:transposase-like protein
MTAGSSVGPAEFLLGITGLSKSQVSVMARDLDELVRDFRERPLDAGPYTWPRGSR